jgi:predicted permease
VTRRGRLRSFLAGCRALLGRRDQEADLDAELDAFVEAAAADSIRRGADGRESVRHARLALGNAAMIKEDTRAVGWEHALELFWQDVRFGARTLRRAPGFAAIVILTLGLGIGGNAAILSVVTTMFFARLPIPAPGDVLRLNDSAPGAGGARRLFGMHSQNVAEVLGRSDLFSGAVAIAGSDLTMTDGGEAERVTVIARTDGWRRTLGVVPVLGRDFTSHEESLGETSGVVLVSDALWHRRYSGQSPGAAAIHLDGRPYTVVGVMPRGFGFPYEADVWMPHLVNAADHARDYAVFARLQTGVSIEQARSALDVLSAALRARYPDELPGYALHARPLRDNLLDNEADTALALASVVGFLLLLACVNVATLLLARSVARRKEFTVRAALGASGRRQLRQMFTETLLLAVCGGLLGLAFAEVIAPLTAVLLPRNIAEQLGLATPRIDWRVLGATSVIVLIAGFAAGIAPAFGAAREHAEALREGGRTGQADHPRSRRLLNAFVIGQAILALILLTGAAAMLQNLRALQRKPLGIRPAGLLTLVLTPSHVVHPDAASRAHLTRRLVNEIRAIGRVDAAGITTVNPFGGSSWGASVIVEGHDSGQTSDAIQINHRLVTPGLFAAMGVPLLRGRDVAWTDDDRHPPVAVVSARMAARLWPGVDAIGKRLRNARPGSPWLTVVGVAGDVADARDPADPDLTWYLPYAQNAGSPAGNDLHLMIRSAGDVLPDVRTAIAAVDATLAPYDVAQMDDYYARTLDRDRFAAALMSLFGGFGLLLAALGAYGVMAFAVAQRRVEIGIRIALGADRRSIGRLVLGTGMRLAALGIIGGSAGAVAIHRVVGSILPAAATAGDITSAAVSAAGLFIILIAACYVPARRATRVEPIDVLRLG